MMQSKANTTQPTKGERSGSYQDKGGKLGQSRKRSVETWHIHRKWEFAKQEEKNRKLELHQLIVHQVYHLV
jgi:hypothetical protein